MTNSISGGSGAVYLRDECKIDDGFSFGQTDFLVDHPTHPGFIEPLAIFRHYQHHTPVLHSELKSIELESECMTALARVI
jgi:hypothetical protein